MESVASFAFNSLAAISANRDFSLSIAFFTAIPFRSLPEDAAVADVFGTFEVFVLLIFINSGEISNSEDAIP